jgi:transcriptional regulator with XRE-family HTH domain
MNENPFVKSDFYAILGSKIRFARKEKGLDQQEFAKCVNLTRTSIINIEKGRQHASVHQIWLMSLFLNIPITDLIPPFDLQNRIVEWEEKIDNNTVIENEGQRKVLIKFFTASRTIK